MNNQTANTAAAAVAALDLKKQSLDAPRFIRKKPQVIHSIEHFSQEIKPPQPSLEEDEKKAGAVYTDEEEEEVAQDAALKKLIEELKEKKQKELELKQSNYINGGSVDTTTQLLKNSRDNSEGVRANVADLKGSTYEELKAKKLQELKQQLLENATSSRQTPSHNFTVGGSGAGGNLLPYQTTVSTTNKILEIESREEESSYKSESTVQYQLNESVQAAIKKGKSDAVDQKNQGNNNRKEDLRKAGLHTNKSKGVANLKQQVSRNSDLDQHLKTAITAATKKTNNDFQYTKRQQTTDSSAGRKRHCFATVSQQEDMNSQYQDQSQPQNLLSEKSQQINFKKLQKDVETAIRSADSKDQKGALTLEELKICFFNLDYLPFMHASESHATQLQYFRQHINTKKSMIMHEKEFMYNFWCTVNPLNHSEIDNAVLYDVLILLIYNVQQPLHTSSSYLVEYLENHYRDTLNIDLEGFGQNYNSNGGGQQYYNDQNPTNLMTTNPLSNLCKYLSYCNLWTIERLSYEFKQIHANRLGHQQFSSTQRRSPSPFAGQNRNRNQSPMQAPNDGRKYKQGIVEEHLSHLTFSPSINPKTVELDQQLTQRLKRDLSSQDGYLLRGGATSQAAPGHQSQRLLTDQDINQEAPPFKRYDLLLYRHQIAEDRIEKAKENKLQRQLEECTFKPNAHLQHVNTLASSKSYNNLQRQANQAFMELTSRIKSQRSKLLENTHSTRTLALKCEVDQQRKKELEECTFKPNITKSYTPRLGQQQVEEMPKGYYEQVNRMRKVTEEKRVMEERQQKKAIGENYEKLKLMNIKPPSFIEKNRAKKQLLMYVDVNINPTKQGRIGIYEGDDVRDLARNFQKTFQLNNNMLDLLTRQLEQHLTAYKQKHGLTDIEGSTFIPSNQPVIYPADGVIRSVRQTVSSVSTFAGMMDYKQPRNEDYYQAAQKSVSPEDKQLEQNPRYLNQLARQAASKQHLADGGYYMADDNDEEGLNVHHQEMIGMNFVKKKNQMRMDHAERMMYSADTPTGGRGANLSEFTLTHNNKALY